jgi:hypothetical protein
VPPPKSPTSTVAESGLAEPLAQPLAAEFVVGQVAGEPHRPADGGRDRGGIDPRGAHQRGEEPRHQRLQRHGATEQPGLAERGLRQIALHRHDQPAFARIVEIGLDRRLTDRILQSGASRLGPQAQQRAAGLAVGLVAMAEAQGAGGAVRRRQHGDAVGGAEIDPEPGGAHPGAPKRWRIPPTTASNIAVVSRPVFVL